MKHTRSTTLSSPEISSATAVPVLSALPFAGKGPLGRECWRYFNALSAIYDEIYELDYPQDTFLLLRGNPQRVLLHETSMSAALERLFREVIHPDDVASLRQFYHLDHIQAALQSGGKTLLRTDFRRCDAQGNARWYSCILFPLGSPDAPASQGKFLNFILDIHDRKQAEALQRKNEQMEQQRLNTRRYQAIMRQTDTLDFEWRIKTGQQYLSPEIAHRFAGKYDNRMLLDIWCEDLVVHPQDAAILHDFAQHVQTRHVCPLPIVIRLRRRDGKHIWCRVAASFIAEGDEDPRLIGTINDVDSETRATLSLKYRVEYDPITGIRNMDSFYEQAAQLLHRHPEKAYMLVRLDVDRFKLINELFGMEEGNRLLCYLARIISEKVGDDATCGRLNADIFCVCLPAAGQAAIAFLNSVSHELDQYPLPYKISLYAGMCLVEDHNTPVHLLCDWAGLALRTIKGSYFRNYSFYNGELRDRILAEKEIENEMGNALLEGQFQLYLQPKVDIATGIIVSAEALSRWQHPLKGLVPPGDFIPLFERNGFVNKLDEYIWRQTCLTLRAWLDKGHTPPPISVNISRTHFHDSKLCDKLLHLVEECNIPPRLLELELTESAYLDNEQRIFEIIAELQSYGFRFSMDDFGTGYSSLSTLKNLPLDVVKIDQTFLNEGLGSQRGRIIIQHTIAMAREMNIQVVAEGVETVEHAAYLLRSHCRIAQGFYYSTPIPLPDFEKLTFGRMRHFPVDPIIQEIADHMEQL